MDRFQDLAIIKLSRFEGNDPTQLNAIQGKLMPYLTSLELLWWSVWWTILGYLVVKYVIGPLVDAERLRRMKPHPSLATSGTADLKQPT